MDTRALEIMVDTVREYKRLQAEAEMQAHSSAECYEAGMRESAELIRDLPEKVRSLFGRAEREAKAFDSLTAGAIRATLLLEKGNFFGMSVLLTPQDSRIDDLIVWSS